MSARFVSLTVTPPDALCILTPVGDRTPPSGVPITATGYGHQTFDVPADVPGWGGNLDITAEGYEPYHAWILIPTTDSELPAVGLIPSIPPWPPVPTRTEVLGVNMHFLGGIVVPSAQYGQMPWWDTCLSWCDAQTRQNAYAMKRNAGDTHAIVHVPSGPCLYNEPNQFYSPDKFGPLDWTSGLTTLGPQFSALIDEVIRAGFRFIVTMDEAQPQSTQIVRLVMQALTPEQLQYGFTMPGYDGVFYGWEPAQIENWATIARTLQPTCYLGLEHNVGHIPLGEGGDDYQPGGRMQGFDIVLGEFGVDGSLQNDATWQVLGRMIRPYHRPPNQQGDPNPPFYLVDSTRGPRAYCCFESDYPYYWVRVDMNDPGAIAQMQLDIDAQRAYFRSLGAQYTG